MRERAVLKIKTEDMQKEFTNALVRAREHETTEVQLEERIIELEDE